MNGFLPVDAVRTMIAKHFGEIRRSGDAGMRLAACELASRYRELFHEGSWREFAFFPGTGRRAVSRVVVSSGARVARLGVLLATVSLQSACASLNGPDYGSYDENEEFNRAAYEFSEVVDRNVLAPVARGYQAITPDAVETGISNFFANLRSLDSSLNGFLQGKPERGGTDALRFLMNTTVGVGGLFDVATGAGLLDQDEDIGQTLAVWGWKNSRYVYVPLVGPSTVRDLPSLLVRALVPRLVLGSAADLGLNGAANGGLGALNIVSARADALSLTDTRDSAALDAYVFTREAFMQRRKYLIFNGDPPVEEFDAFFDEFDDE